uniref:Bm12513 n=3 Tax=Brugia TaxID=6278 RepID=A0A1I9G5R6_BRUMA|nr:Bm12513 [Brugia malayi]
MFKHFYGDNITEDMAMKFRNAAVALNVQISPAQVQGYLLLRKEDPQASIDDIATITYCK